MDDFWRRLRLLAGAAHSPVASSGFADEHERAELYALSFDKPGAQEMLLQAIALEPDASVKEWVVVHMAERVDDQWAGEWLAVVPSSSYARQRAHEVAALRALGAGSPLAPDAVEQWSDWMQRRAVEGSTRRDVIAALAAGGRTKRVRATASTRLEGMREVL